MEHQHRRRPLQHKINLVRLTIHLVVRILIRLHLADNKLLPACPFGATCYRKNLLHFAQFSHPFDLLNPDDSDEEEDDQTKKPTKKVETITGAKKRKAESEKDAEKTEEYNSDDVSA